MASGSKKRGVVWRIICVTGNMVSVVEHLLAWSGGSFGDLYFPSKFQWDRIPTDPVQYVAHGTMRYLGFFGVPSVGPVGDFSHILDLFRVILTFIFYTLYHGTSSWNHHLGELPSIEEAKPSFFGVEKLYPPWNWQQFFAKKTVSSKATTKWGCQEPILDDIKPLYPPWHKQQVRPWKLQWLESTILSLRSEVQR